jgi:nucleotide-binding universal stress UspA family protein
MIEFKRILHPTDFSDSGSPSLSAACELASRFGAELHVLHVVQDVASIAAYGVAEAYLPPEWRTEIREQAEQSLQNVPPAELAGNMKIVRAIAEGSPYFEVVEYARQHAIDLIVMGTHGRTGIPHIFLGSVAERVVREAPCAVLVIRPKKA